MALTITRHTYLNGTKHTQMRINIVGDGTTQLSNEVLYDYSADTEVPGDRTPTQIKIKRMWLTSPDTGYGTIDFHGTTANEKIIGLPSGKVSDISWDYFGGLRNGATDPTGDIVINTTTAIGTGQLLSIILDIHKS